MGIQIIIFNGGLLSRVFVVNKSIVFYKFLRTIFVLNYMQVRSTLLAVRVISLRTNIHLNLGIIIVVLVVFSEQNSTFSLLPRKTALSLFLFMKSLCVSHRCS